MVTSVFWLVGPKKTGVNLSEVTLDKVRLPTAEVLLIHPLGRAQVSDCWGEGKSIFISPLTKTQICLAHGKKTLGPGAREVGSISAHPAQQLRLQATLGDIHFQDVNFGILWEAKVHDFWKKVNLREQFEVEHTVDELLDQNEVLLYTVFIDFTKISLENLEHVQPGLDGK